MSFDLYFAGQGPKEAFEFHCKNNMNKLFSQLNERAGIKKYIAEVNDINATKLFIDSGAYSAYTKQKVVDVDDYISYINSITDKVTIFAQLDKIPGEFRKPKTKEQRLEAPKLSWENYLYMKDKVKEPDKLIPIFHQGEDYKWLENMLEYKNEDGKHIPYIGISPAVDLPGIEQFLDTSFDIIANSSNPNVKTHAFGMTQLDLLEQYPYTSADSTSWVLCAAMGGVNTPWGVIRVSERAKFESDYIGNQPKEAYDNFCAYIKELGFTFEEIANSAGARAICNSIYYKNWADNYKYKGRAYKKKLLF